MMSASEEAAQRDQVELAQVLDRGVLLLDEERAQLADVARVVADGVLGRALDVLEVHRKRERCRVKRMRVFGGVHEIDLIENHRRSKFLDPT